MGLWAYDLCGIGFQPMDPKIIGKMPMPLFRRLESRRSIPLKFAPNHQAMD
jgi:hypothetical protein